MTYIDWLKRLVAFDTTSSKSNLALIDTIADWLKTEGVSFHITKHPTERKANLFATIPGSASSLNDGLILSGHTDVVPVIGQNWATDPFTATEKNAALYGRGTCDMKGFVAVVLSLTPTFLKMNLKNPLHFAFSYDEEVGCCGAPYMIQDALARGYRPRGCIVGEPSMMRPIVAHKGIQVFHCRFKGVPVHSSLTPKGCNAIEYAAKFVVFLRKLAEDLKSKGPTDEHFDVPFTTLSTNLIQGGLANNIVPEHCEVTFEFRQLPNANAADIQKQIEDYIQTTLLPEMKAESEAACIELDTSGAVPSFAANAEDALYQNAMRIAGESEMLKVGYCTEAGLFAKANIPTIIWGPGSITEAHRLNEYVTLEQLQLCKEYIHKIVETILI